MKSIDIDVNEAVEKTIELTQQAFDPNEKEKFGKYAPIYLAPTSNVLDSTKKVVIPNGEKALTIGSQGAYIFELLLNGYKKIDCFDINILEYFYYEYTKYFILMFPYRLFIENFTSSNKDLILKRKLLLNRILYEELEEILPDQIYEYWYELYNSIMVERAIYSRWCRTQYIMNEEYLKKYCSYYSEDEYNRLKKILMDENVEIDYHICDVENLDKEFEENKYDTIILDNIFQYYKQLSKYGDVYSANREIKNNLMKMLNDGGKMMVCYGFEVPTMAIKKMRNNNYKESFIQKIILDNEIKNGFIPLMVKTYNDYQVEFIEGVEQERKTENVLLTLTK